MTDDEPPLPALQRAVLDDAGLRELLGDLAALAAVDSIVVRAREGTRAKAVNPLEDILPALASIGAAVQIRYQFEGRGWCDTLSRTTDGVQLVRIAVA